MKKDCYCAICGVKCTGKLKIRARVNFDYPSCRDCFDKTLDLPMGKVRKMIRRGR